VIVGHFLSEDILTSHKIIEREVCKSVFLTTTISGPVNND
jgi:hypothetical protein